LEAIVRSKSRTFFALCLCFLSGVLAASLRGGDILPQGISLALLFSLATLLLSFSRYPRVRFIAAVGAVFIAGSLRYAAALPNKQEYGIHNLAGQSAAVTAYIAAEPDIRLSDQRLIASVSDPPGKVYLKIPLYPRYAYGDKVKITCRLQLPEAMETENGRVFRYDMYLARLGVFALCENPVIAKIGGGEGSRARAEILRAKALVAGKVELLWSEPHASFMAGLLYGYRGGLGSLQEQFNLTGVTHIVAVSGYNITIIATILISLCTYLYIPRQRAFWFVVAGIVLFVAFTGASASVVRAGIMGIIALLGRQLGRPSRSGNVLVLAAAVMVAHNPFVLLSDAGFQLSFLSTLGLVYINPLIKNRFLAVPGMSGLNETLTSTLSAIIATCPLILYQFGRLSLVAPVVNILILWLIPWLMLLGAAAVAVSFFSGFLGQIAAGIAWVGLEYIIVVVRWFAAWPWASISVGLPWWGMAAMYCGMLYLAGKYFGKGR